MKRLTRSHWESRPQQTASVSHVETRTVVRMLGGRVIERSSVDVVVREVWKIGGCRHIILDTETRRRVLVACPDCVAPDEVTS